MTDYPPGDPRAPPHRHPGTAFGYVLEGGPADTVEHLGEPPGPTTEAEYL
ncbi:cupin domain-containing protein [Nonomuraea sp. 3N208]